MSEERAQVVGDTHSARDIGDECRLLNQPVTYFSKSIGNASPQAWQDGQIKSALVTGATGTIGKAVAFKLARMGVKLRLVCRKNRAKVGDDLVRRLRDVSGSGDVELLHADLSSLTEVRRLAEEYKRSTGEHLDILINNAAVFGLRERKESADGHEMTLAINFLSHYALTLLLLDRMTIGGPARIINVASEEYKAITDFEDALSDYDAQRSFTWRQYALSKLFFIHFTRVLAEKLRGTSVTVNAMHPGSVPGNMWKGLPLLLQLRVWRFRIMAPIFAPEKLMTPDKAANTYARLALSPDVENLTGRYFFREKEAPLNDIALNNDYAQKTWDLAARLTQIDLPCVSHQ